MAGRGDEKNKKRFILGLILGLFDIGTHLGISRISGVGEYRYSAADEYNMSGQLREFISYTFHFDNEWYFKFLYRFLFVLAVAIFAALIGELITVIVRSFTPSTKVLTFTKILEQILAFVVWLPITSVIMTYLTPIIQLISQKLIYVQIFIHVLIFAFLYTYIGSVFSKVFTVQLTLDTKRCTLEKCRVKDEETYVVEKVMVTKSKFHECYGIIRNNVTEDKDIFYRITERSFSGKEVVKRWKYFANGNYTEMSDKDLCRVIIRNAAGGGPVEEYY